jgi:hypothetical protein
LRTAVQFHSMRRATDRSSQRADIAHAVVTANCTNMETPRTIMTSERQRTESPAYLKTGITHSAVARVVSGCQMSGPAGECASYLEALHEPLSDRCQLLLPRRRPWCATAVVQDYSALTHQLQGLLLALRYWRKSYRVWAIHAGCGTACHATPRFQPGSLAPAARRVRVRLGATHNMVLCRSAAGCAPWRQGARLAASSAHSTGVRMKTGSLHRS